MWNDGKTKYGKNVTWKQEKPWFDNQVPFGPYGWKRAFIFHKAGNISIAAET